MDVREQHEMDTASLPNFRLFPLSLSEEWGPHIGTMLNPDMETVVRMCRDNSSCPCVQAALTDIARSSVAEMCPVHYKFQPETSVLWPQLHCLVT